MTSETIRALCALVLTALLSATSLAEPIRTVVIDPGHGGDENVGDQGQEARTYSTKNNAWTASGHAISDPAKRPPETWEKFLTLELSKMIKDRIDKRGTALGIRCVLTRSDDRNLTMAERAQVAADNKAVSFVSIHFNSTPAAHRTEAVIRASDALRPNSNHARDKKFAGLLVDATAKAISAPLAEQGLTPVTRLVDDTKVPLGWMNPETKKREGGSFLLYHIAGHEILGQSPACILEIEFIDNPKVDAALTKDGKWRKTFPIIAEAVASEILRWHAPESSQKPQ